MLVQFWYTRVNKKPTDFTDTRKNSLWLHRFLAAVSKASGKPCGWEWTLFLWVLLNNLSGCPCNALCNQLWRSLKFSLPVLLALQRFRSGAVCIMLLSNLHMVTDFPWEAGGVMSITSLSSPRGSKGQRFSKNMCRRTCGV